MMNKKGRPRMIQQKKRKQDQAMQSITKVLHDQLEGYDVSHVSMSSLCCYLLDSKLPRIQAFVESSLF